MVTFCDRMFCGTMNFLQVMALIQPIRSMSSLSGLSVNLIFLPAGSLRHWLNAAWPGSSSTSPAPVASDLALAPVGAGAPALPLARAASPTPVPVRGPAGGLGGSGGPGGAGAGLAGFGAGAGGCAGGRWGRALAPAGGKEEAGPPHKRCHAVS